MKRAPDMEGWGRRAKRVGGSSGAVPLVQSPPRRSGSWEKRAGTEDQMRQAAVSSTAAGEEQSAGGELGAVAGRPRLGMVRHRLASGRCLSVTWVQPQRELRSRRQAGLRERVSILHFAGGRTSDLARGVHGPLP
ncbi:hypothetical protein GCM10022403_087180 [Streptomyces coacervatus]|uniref:Uncharacterized protein n=1 Tax=Streptomyces coacervatus TaxID=647381 RepID=A0ABP7JDQ0_9ACTN